MFFVYILYSLTLSLSLCFNVQQEKESTNRSKQRDLPNTESFFPKPSESSPQIPSSPLSPSSLKKQTPPTTTEPKSVPPPSSAVTASSVAAVKTKAKAPYVPPAPIVSANNNNHKMESSKRQQHPLPRPYNPSDDILLPTEKEETAAADQDGSFSLLPHSDDACHILKHLPLEGGDLDDDEGDQEFHGLLDLHQSAFDPTAISVITSITMEALPESTNNSEPPLVSQYQYPVEPPEPNSSSGMRFDELYRLKGVLGTGAFSTVREGFHRSSSTISFAVKCINRKKLSEEDEAALLDEVSILKEMKHDHIIRLFDFFEEPSTYYLVMERMRGGELFDRIVAKAYYNEKEARDTCKIVLEAVCYCHENHVAHRDLKPENLLLLSDVDDSAVKIADFGFAKKVYEPNSLTTQCGTPGYVAPEILEGTAYDQRADMWSVGVILYILLGGYPPFIESTQRDLFRKIRKGDYEFHEEYWGTVSAEAKELISSLLTVDRAVRLTADEALENAWILGDDAKLAQRDLGDNLHKLRNFNGKRKFRAAVSTVLAVNKLNLVGKEFFSHYTSSGSKDEITGGALSDDES